jgi:voltage-gated potassium channel
VVDRDDPDHDGFRLLAKTDAGRILCFFLALYSFTVFGYVTATLATYFVGRDAASSDSEIAGQHSIDALRDEVAKLRDDIRGLHGFASANAERGERR